MNITIILPTYNEAENIPRLVNAIFSLPRSDIRLLFIDDNSPDGTGKIIDGLAAEHPARVQVIHREGKLGLGSAYIRGFQSLFETDVEVIGMMDSDFSHDPQKLPEMIAALENADVAIGSRYVPGGSVDKDWPIWRKGLSAWANFYARTILSLPIKDATTGYRLWRIETLKGMPIERILSSGYVFLVEMVYVAHKLGYRISEVPIYFADRKWGKTKMDFKNQIEAAIRVWQVRFAYRNLKK
ncbi:MAG: polyprenol monophosphomannose synthase [Anaerolineales bacterium]|jgi:dolichol-phosphate mannosyltransferase